MSISPTTRILVATIALLALSRLLPHPPNFSPLVAVALFSGALCRDWRLALGIPLAAMLLADLWLGFHATLAFVYLGMALAVAVGRALGERRRPALLLGAGLLGSVVFFLVSNAGVWLTQDLYPPTAAGLAACYLAAVPFFHNTLLATLLWGALLFGAEHWLAARRPGAARPA
jgi:hypothetical protein